ncbi:MAG: hypothetical protein GX801_09530 [Fibrobacter sp.]|nr:hypothetical protein [Fibrobacter sp.]
MKNTKSNRNANISNKKVWNLCKDYHKTEGYKLEKIFDIYLPFWECKQKIAMEKSLEVDRFSRIILELVKNNITTHAEICNFLGVDENSFVSMQFHFLLKNDLLRERDEQIGSYEITYEGLDFLENNSKIKNIEIFEFVYYLIDDLENNTESLRQIKFNPNYRIDEVSAGLNEEFSGYNLLQTHKLKKNGKAKTIKHKRQKPTFAYMSKQRNEFANFFGENELFYDFADNKLETHRRSICFFSLLYVNEANPEDRILETRQSPKSVKNFKEPILEHKLTKLANDYLHENPNFV